MDVTIAFNQELFITILVFLMGAEALLEILLGIAGAEKIVKSNYDGSTIIKGFLTLLILAVCFLV